MNFMKVVGYVLENKDFHVCGYTGGKIVIQNSKEGIVKPKSYKLYKDKVGMYFNFKGSKVYLDQYVERTDKLIRNWYMEVYPSDELGEEIKGDVTFNGLFATLDCHKDVYEFLGVCDSIVRERVFQGLADYMSVDYDYVYNQWLAI